MTANGVVWATKKEELVDEIPVEKDHVPPEVLCEI